MDGTILIALAILAFIALIVIMITFKTRKEATKRRSELMNVFDRIVAEEHLNVDHKEILRHKIIAIDTLKKKLVVVQNHSDIHYDIINLDIINDCKIKRAGSKITETKKNGSKVSEENVTVIYLSLMLENRSVSDIQIYSELNDGILEKMPLTAVAEKWQGITRQALTK